MIWNLMEKQFFGLPIEKENQIGTLENLLKLLPKSDSINPAVTARVLKGYDDIFYTMIPEALEKYDYNTHVYWPSSPAGGWKKPITSRVPQSGDLHFYIAVLNLPFSAYLSTRSHFFSEHGFQAWPDKKVVEQFTATADRKVNSPIMQAHNKALGGNGILDKYIAMYYHTPKDFDSYLYISQVLQAEGMKLALETHRRWMPYTMGTLYWQLNDVWPVASWSSLDYQNNPKALEFIVKKAFSEVIVVPSDFKNDFKVNVVSDSREPFKAKMEARITDFEGRELWKKSLSVNMDANSSKEIYAVKTEDLVRNMDTTRIVFTVKIMKDNKLLASNLYYFSAAKNLKLEKPVISKTISATDQGFLVTLSADKLVKDLYLSTDVKGEFSDNYFDLLPGEKVTVKFNTKEKIENFESKLKLVSVVDTY
jgi:beta-mannosidase